MSEVQQSIVNAHTQLTSHSSWESDFRQAAITHVETRGLPHKKIEAWKYTGLFQLQTQSFEVANFNSVTEDQLQQLYLPAGPRVVCIDGHYHAALSTANDITILSIKDLLKTQPERLEPYLNQSTSPNEIGIADTNTALFQDGLFLQISDDTKMQPIVLVFITTEQIAPSMNHVRNIISLGKHSQTTLLEYHMSLATKAQLVSTINEVFLDDGANCHWVRFQQVDLQQTHISETRVEQQRDSQFNHVNIDHGSQLSRHDLHINLNQAGAHCALHGLYDVNGTQHIDNHTTINHQVSDTTSYEYYKGVIDDNGHAVFNGRVIVHPDAQRIATEQHNPNILLSKRAEIDTKPQLEIYNDDVKASHGATVGQLDESAIFYLQSRGINREAAITILLQGFIQEIIGMVTIPAWQTYISACIMENSPHECIG